MTERDSSAALRTPGRMEMILEQDCEVSSGEDDAQTLLHLSTVNEANQDTFLRLRDQENSVVLETNAPYATREEPFLHKLTRAMTKLQHQKQGDHDPGHGPPQMASDEQEQSDSKGTDHEIMKESEALLDQWKGCPESDMVCPKTVANGAVVNGTVHRGHRQRIRKTEGVNHRGLPRFKTTSGTRRVYSSTHYVSKSNALNYSITVYRTHSSLSKPFTNQRKRPEKIVPR